MFRNTTTNRTANTRDPSKINNSRAIAELRSRGQSNKNRANGENKYNSRAKFIRIKNKKNELRKPIMGTCRIPGFFKRISNKKLSLHGENLKRNL